MVMVGTGLVSQRCSTSRASETAERIQKEKMAAALFGGISATQPPAPPPPSAAATSPAINTTPGGQWGAKPIAVADPTPTAPAPAPAPVPVVAAPHQRLIYLVLMHQLQHISIFYCRHVGSLVLRHLWTSPSLQLLWRHLCTRTAVPPLPPPAAPVDPFADVGLLDGTDDTPITLCSRWS